MIPSDMTLYREWPHAPSHLFVPGTAYMVTAGTYGKALLFNTDEKRDLLLQSLFEETTHWGWNLQAWAVMANHYHFVACSPDDTKSLICMLMSLHSKTAIALNRMDDVKDRKVWFQYRDTCLTYERSCMARLKYVHCNPVKHGLVENADLYRWCSMGWFSQKAENSFRKMVLSFKLNCIKVEDDF